MLRDKLNSFTKTILKVLSSRRLFWLIVGLLVFQALWIAASFQYPLLYDEEYHYGLIRVFTENSWPIINEQPEHYDVFRHIAREGSYLYHYLLSYPTQLIQSVTDSFMVQIIFLRAINIGLFAWGLVLFWRLLLKIGLRQLYINVATLFFVLLPIVPLVAATINYDNLIFPLTALYLILCVQLLNKKELGWLDFSKVIIVGLLALLVKITFLLVVVASVAFVSIYLVRKYGGKRILRDIKATFHDASLLTKLSVIVPMVLLSVWLGSIHGYNFVRYGNYRPSCERTLSEQRCMASPIAKRNMELRQTKDERPRLSPTDFSIEWFRRMLFYTNWSARRTIEGEVIEVKEPLPVIHFVVFSLVISGTLSLAYAWRAMPKNIFFYFLLAITVFSLAVIFVQNASTYYRYNQPLAIQPRYLLNILLPVMTIMVLGINHAVRAVHPFLKIVALLIVFVMYLSGAGLVSHLVSGEPTWYWSNTFVININKNLHDFLRKIVIN